MVCAGAHDNRTLPGGTLKNIAHAASQCFNFSASFRAYEFDVLQMAFVRHFSTMYALHSRREPIHNPRKQLLVSWS